MTTAVDTNVVVRLLVGDDAGQARRSRAVFAGGPVLVTTTVLLETEWVLRGAYGIEPARIAALLQALLGLPDVSTDDPAAVSAALDWTAAGMDFADALHLAGAGGAERFVTFDRRLVRAAKRLTNLNVSLP